MNAVNRPVPAAGTQDLDTLRSSIRAFLEGEIAAGTYSPESCAWTTYNAEFSRRAGAAGFVGMTVLTELGGHGRSFIERYVVTEEMLAAGAPCGAHWIADRQSAPQIVRHGSARAKAEILPRIVRGECVFGIGMSEPGSGSDLAAVRTRGEKVDGGWRINGQKIWTTNAHHAHYLLALVRTGGSEGGRHEGLTQFIVDMSSPGIDIRPIYDIAGDHEFNEVFFTDCFIPDDMVVGEPGTGWKMVTDELAFERSGPDRLLSSHRLFMALIDQVGQAPDCHAEIEIGRLVAHLATLRAMSRTVSEKLNRGELPNLDASVVKMVGTTFEREIPEIARNLVDRGSVQGPDRERFQEAFEHIVLRAPSFTLRGGTHQILLGMIARGMGLR